MAEEPSRPQLGGCLASPLIGQILGQVTNNT